MAQQVAFGAVEQRLDLRIGSWIDVVGQRRGHPVGRQHAVRVRAAQVVDEGVRKTVDRRARIEFERSARLGVRGKPRGGQHAVDFGQFLLEALGALGIVLEQFGEHADADSQAHGVFLQVVGSPRW
ncbi:hypothetical protein EJP69_12530 [Variovorax gossypii]|uniref:Uncharacterized protein n=1 Tax=Variovorax gossypii TaxID=1679495 RepID=A0A3S0J6Z1_9BURK|nr:hypothetical protein EJP69_12530 [Variovorax gossypii]